MRCEDQMKNTTALGE